MRIYIINGPNLNLLGKREKEHYGQITLKEIKDLCQSFADKTNINLRFEQKNHEGDLIELIHEAVNEAADGLLINGAGYSHTSIALLDALKIFKGPVVEVHLSNIYKRDPFRYNSYLSNRADAVISGCGEDGYLYGLSYLVKKISI